MTETQTYMTERQTYMTERQTHKVSAQRTRNDTELVYFLLLNLPPPPPPPPPPLNKLSSSSSSSSSSLGEAGVSLVDNLRRGGHSHSKVGPERGVDGQIVPEVHPPKIVLHERLQRIAVVYKSVKRDLPTWQKTPIHMANGAY